MSSTKPSTTPVMSMRSISNALMRYIAGGDCDNVDELVSRLFTMLKEKNMITDSEYDHAITTLIPVFVAMYDRLRSDVNCKTDIIEITTFGEARALKKTYFKSATSIAYLLDIMLLMIETDGIHTITANCKMDKRCKKCTKAGKFDASCASCTFCPHTDYDGHDGSQITHNVGCSYHESDELTDHMIMAGVLSTLYHMRKFPADSIDEFYATFFTGTLHDIGKAFTTTFIESKLMVSWPAHGIVGAIQLRALYSDKMTISADVFDRICRAIGLHMCSYHTGVTDTLFEQRMSLLSHVRPDDHVLRKTITCLGYGDQYGKFPNDEHNVTRSDFDHLYDNVVDAMNESFDSDFCNMSAESGIIVMPIGDSGAGKTTFCKSLSDAFGDDKVYVVSRDETTASVVTGVTKRYDGATYSLMYAVYNAVKSVAKLIRQIAKMSDSKKIEKKLVAGKQLKTNIQNAIDAWNEHKPDTQISIDRFLDDECDSQVCIDNGINFIDIAGKVTGTYKQRLDDALQQMDDPESPVSIVVIDTLINALPNANYRPFPDAVKTHLKVGVHIQSFCENSGAHNGSDKSINTVCTSHLITKPMHKTVWNNLHNMRPGPADYSYRFGMGFKPDIVMTTARTPRGIDAVSGFDSVLDTISYITGIDVN